MNLPGSHSEVQGVAQKKGMGLTKKSSNLKSETRYQTVLAMDAINQQDKNRGSMPQAVGIDDVGDEPGPNMFQSDYYRTTQNQKFAT